VLASATSSYDMHLSAVVLVQVNAAASGAGVVSPLPGCQRSTVVQAVRGALAHALSHVMHLPSHPPSAPVLRCCLVGAGAGPAVEQIMVVVPESSLTSRLLPTYSLLGQYWAGYWANVTVSLTVVRH